MGYRIARLHVAGSAKIGHGSTRGSKMVMLISSSAPSESNAYDLPGEMIVAGPYMLEVLRKAPTAVGAYNAFSVSCSGLITTSFQLPWELDSNLPKVSDPRLAVVGTVAKEPAQGALTVSESEAFRVSRICALKLLAQVRDPADGDFGCVQLLRVEDFVAAEQADQIGVPRILDAASLLLKGALAPDQGAHARTAVIVHSNPLNVPSMLGAGAELRW